jgi:hypothetical protein
MSNHRSEERALEVMRKQLASEPVPDLPWNDMERDLMARLDDAPMTSQPRSLDAQIDDVPVFSSRNPRAQFVRVGFVVFAAAAAFALVWMSPLNTGKVVVISTATPSVAAPATSNAPVDRVSPEIPSANTAAVPQIPPSASAEALTRTIKSADVRKAFTKCVVLDKRYGTVAKPKLKGEKLQVFLEKDGSIATIRFDSPLEPTVMQCVFAALRSGRFVKTKSPVTIQF